MVELPFQFNAGVNVNEESATETVTLSLSLSAVKSRVSPSTSEALRGTVSVVSSFISCAAISSIIGVSFTGLTLMDIVPVSEDSPSEIEKSRESIPK